MICRNAWAVLFNDPWVCWGIPASFVGLPPGNAHRAELLLLAHLVASVTNHSCLVWLGFNLKRYRALSAYLVHVVLILQIFEVSELRVGVLDVLNCIFGDLCLTMLWIYLVNWDAARVSLCDCHQVPSKFAHADLMSSLKLILNGIILTATALVSDLELRLVRDVRERRCRLVCHLVQRLGAGQVAECCWWLAVNQCVVVWCLWAV